jgi:hypothetical protein
VHHWPELLGKTAREQLRTAITPKRIRSLKYVHDKRIVAIEVGAAHPAHPRYTILAIFESQPHIVVTQASTGQPGPTIIVASNEITELTEFDR